MWPKFKETTRGEEIYFFNPPNSTSLTDRSRPNSSFGCGQNFVTFGVLPKLLLLFVGVPLLEIMILVKMGQVIGFWETIFLIVGTGIAGAALARAQGLTIWYEIQNDLAEGRMPPGKLVDGILVLLGGIVLLTPGLLTDILGFALLVPLTREPFKRWLQKKFLEMSRTSETRFTHIIR